MDDKHTWEEAVADGIAEWAKSRSCVVSGVSKELIEFVNPGAFLTTRFEREMR